MKRFFIFIVVAMSALVIGGLAGYSIAKRGQTSDDREYYLMHEGFARQTLVYMRFVKAEESGQPEQMQDLRRQALSTFLVYVDEVADMQARGFQWAPLDRELHTFAVAYLAEHPKEK